MRELYECLGLKVWSRKIDNGLEKPISVFGFHRGCINSDGIISSATYDPDEWVALQQTLRFQKLYLLFFGLYNHRIGFRLWVVGNCFDAVVHDRRGQNCAPHCSCRWCCGNRHCNLHTEERRLLEAQIIL